MASKWEIFIKPLRLERYKYLDELRSCMVLIKCYAIRYFLTFVKSLLILQEDQGIYATMVKNMIQEDRYRLVVNINDLRRKNPVRTIRYFGCFNSHCVWQTSCVNCNVRNNQRTGRVAAC